MSEPTLKLHRGVYVVQTIIDGRRIRRSLGTSDKAEAQRRLDHLTLTNAVIDRNRQKTVEELFEAYTSHLSNSGKNTKHWKQIWKPLSAAFGTSYPQYITPEKCAEYCKNRGVSAGSLNLELGLLRTVFNFAYKHKLIPNAIYIYVHRMNAIAKMAIKSGRKIVILGRSLKTYMDSAFETGHSDIPPDELYLTVS